MSEGLIRCMGNPECATQCAACRRLPRRPEAEDNERWIDWRTVTSPCDRQMPLPPDVPPTNLKQL
jgi:hypothetical protein